MVNLFELQDEKIVLNEICFNSKTLKEVTKVFKKDKNYMKVFLAIFYMTCPDNKRNPYWQLREHEKEEIIMRECGIDFSTDEPVFQEALDFCNKLYSTPTRRLYLASKKGLDNVAEYIENNKIKQGADGNEEIYSGIMMKIAKMNEEFKKLERVHEEEISAALRGGASLAYDEQ